MSRTFSIKTLGCKLNQYESALAAEQLLSRGWEMRPFGETVDIVIVNSCTVTDRSDKKCRNYIRQGAHFARTGKTVVTGCLAERDAPGLRAMPEVLAVFGNSDKGALAEKIGSIIHTSETGTGSFFRGDKSPEAPDIPCRGTEQQGADTFTDSAGMDDDAPLPLDRTRGFLKIQDGCDGRCSYCIVPSVRGGPRSRDFGAVMEHAEKLIDAGCPELVLTGITIGRYESCGRDLAGLLEALSLLEGNFRLRITSIEPKHLSRRLIDLLGSPRICPHIHLPLQSGSDPVLKCMQRPYTAAEYLEIVETIRKKSEKIAIGTDIIIGFPGEEEADFLESLMMVEQAGFSYVHQFSFSPRSGTPASAMDGLFPAGEIAQRSDRMREMSASVGLKYRRRFIGEILPCVIEANRHRGGHVAVSANYLKIDLENGPDNRIAVGKIAGVRLMRAEREGNTGVLIPVAVY